MSRSPDPKDYVTKVDPRLTRKDGPLQVLSSPKSIPETEPDIELEIEP
jgi:hypothetical protein